MLHRQVYIMVLNRSIINIHLFVFQTKRRHLLMEYRIKNHIFLKKNILKYRYLNNLFIYSGLYRFVNQLFHSVDRQMRNYPDRCEFQRDYCYATDIGYAKCFFEFHSDRRILLLSVCTIINSTLYYITDW